MGYPATTTAAHWGQMKILHFLYVYNELKKKKKKHI